jgi:hypothetical protein
MDDVDVNAPAVKEAVQQACIEVGLPLAYRSVVSQMLRTPRSEWPACCGEGCFPCQQSLADAAVRTLELLGRRTEPSEP